LGPSFGGSRHTSALSYIGGFVGGVARSLPNGPALAT